jgi:deoxyribodipyrimidine photo-lyase
MKFVYFWFRRDLRDQDQVGFYQALKSGFPVRPIFIFDQQILSRVVDSSDARVTFIYDEVLKLKQKFQELGSDLIVQYGDPVEIWSELCQDPELQGIYCNHDHEPYPQWRDRQVQKKASEKNIPFHSFKDISIFERSEILTGQGTVYSVYTAYKNKWLQTLTQKDLYFYDCQKQIQNLDHFTAPSMPSLQKIGFQRSGLKIPSNAVSVSCLQNYHLERDIPSLDSTSHLGIHLRFGTVSVRQMVLFAQKHSSVWLSELIWREFLCKFFFIILRL